MYDSHTCQPVARTGSFVDDGCDGWVTVPFESAFRPLPGAEYVVAVDPVTRYVKSGAFAWPYASEGGLLGINSKLAVYPTRVPNYDETHDANYWVDGEAAGPG